MNTTHYRVTVKHKYQTVILTKPLPEAPFFKNPKKYCQYEDAKIKALIHEEKNGYPVVFGPNNKKFQEAQALLQCKGSFEFTDATSFTTLVDDFIQHPDKMEAAGQAASQYIYGNAGAVDKCYDAIFRR